MAEKDCLFCRIVAGDVPSAKIYEDEHTLAFLDTTPVNPGHALVVPKTHTVNIFDTPDNVRAQMTATAKKVAFALREGLGAEGINITSNNEKTAGQAIFHAHLHVIPRYEGDGHRPWRGAPYPEGETEKTAEKIKTAL